MVSITSILYLLLFLTGCLAALWASPFYGVLVYMTEYLVNPPARWWHAGLPQWRYSMVVMCFVMISWFFRQLQYRENRFLKLPQTKWLALMSAVVVITSLWAIDPELHQDLTIRYLKVLLFVVLAYKVTDTPGKFEAMMATFLLGTGYLSALIWETGRTGAGRLEGIGCADSSDSNGTASLLATVVPILAFYVLFSRRRCVQFASLVGLAFIFNAIILLNSRGAIVAMVLSGLFFCYNVFREKGLSGQKFKILVGVFCACCLFIYLADEVFWERMATLQEIREPAEEETHTRVDYWMATPLMLEEYPLGGGARTYHLLSPDYLPEEWLTKGKRAVHSIWFEVLSEYGYHGLFLFAGYVWATSQLACRVRRRLGEIGDSYHAFQAVALQCSWLSMLVTATFINAFYSEITFWLPMFIGVFANLYLFRPAQAAAQAGPDAQAQAGPDALGQEGASPAEAEASLPETVPPQADAGRDVASP